LAPKFHQLSIREVRRETPECVSVSFDVPADLQEAYTWQAGQYLTLNAEINGEQVRRSYSICTAPFENDLRVAVKLVPAGKFSTFANETLKTGDQLEVMTPTGNFTSPAIEDKSRRYVAFAAGSGITPILSLIKSILHDEPHSVVTLFYGNRTVESIIFREALDALKNTYIGRLSVHHLLSRESLGHELFNGRIDEARTARFCGSLFDPATVDLFLLCGPEQMIHAVKSVLEDNGVPDQRIRYELFTTPSSAQREVVKTESATHDFDPERESQVTIRLDGNSFQVQIPFGGQSILDAALASGADLPFACKGGVCCTCRAKLLEGEADMDVNYALEPEEVENGFILTCQSHPRSDALVVDFDVS
jgi:ring-1,2-phenylacetyl-CoA epoxidase subunit PaaE